MKRLIRNWHKNKGENFLNMKSINHTQNKICINTKLRRKRSKRGNMRMDSGCERGGN